MKQLMPVFLLMSLLWTGACRRKGEEGEFGKFTSRFVYSTLAMSPVTATSVGYHEHQEFIWTSNWTT